MDRREFVGWTTGALAAGVLTDCAGHGMNATSGAVAPSPIDATAFHAARRFADTAFGRIAYVERGAGKAALFLHGFPLNGFQWRGALERLSAHRRCIAADFMGLGYSEIPEGQSLRPEVQADMLAALLDRLSIPVVDLVGNDSGGAIAQLFLARYPNRVRTVLLTNCDARQDNPPTPFLQFVAWAREGTWADRSLPPVLADKSIARSSRGIGGIAYSNPANLTDEAIECYFAPLVSSPLRKRQYNDFTIGLERVPLVEAEPALRRCTTPVRIVWGAADTFFPQSYADWLDQLFQHSRGIRRVAGAKLYFPEEMPDIIAEEARKLWDVSAR